MYSPPGYTGLVPGVFGVQLTVLKSKYSKHIQTVESDSFSFLLVIISDNLGPPRLILLDLETYSSYLGLYYLSGLPPSFQGRRRFEIKWESLQLELSFLYKILTFRSFDFNDPQLRLTWKWACEVQITHVSLNKDHPTTIRDSITKYGRLHRWSLVTEMSWELTLVITDIIEHLMILLKTFSVYVWFRTSEPILHVIALRTD